MERIFTKIDKAVWNFNCFIAVRKRLAELEVLESVKKVILSSAYYMASWSSSNNMAASWQSTYQVAHRLFSLKRLFCGNTYSIDNCKILSFFV